MFQKALFVFLLAAITSLPLFGQDTWDLKRAVDYAITNNISVKQANISATQAELDFKVNQTGIYPTAVFNNNWNMSFGRRENPTTGIFENTNALASTFNFQSSFNIFNFYSQRNTIAAFKYQLASSQATEQKAKNDIALRVANVFLLVLQSKEQVGINELQIKLTTEQLGVTRKRVDAGSLPELNAAEIEAQLARDSSTFVSSVANRELQLLQLKAILNLDAGAPFDIVTPDIESMPMESLADMQPEVVYNLALTNLPQQRINDLNQKAAEKRRDAARGALYPSLGGFVGLSTNFYSPLQRSIPGSTASGEQSTGLFVRNAGTTLPVFSPTFTGKTVNRSFGQIWNGFGTQLSDQFGQLAGVGISVPIFNGFQAKTNLYRANLNIKSVQLQRELDNQTLKQEIYTAYNNAVAALQLHTSSRKAVETAQRSYNLGKKRYDVNLLSSFELITNQNNLFRAQIDLLLARYDYVFKMKLLEFYKGQGMRF
ncbi:MAG: TolC family protein [Chitinophagaceae bacterium]